MRTLGVPINDEGIDVDALEATIKANPDAHLLYVIPTFQNPMGISWSVKTRKAVYALAKKYGLIILEDNPYGETRFAGEELPTLKSMDEDGIVVYCSTLSKVLSAGMRVGFVVAPEQIASKMVIVKQTEDVHTNLFFQMLCHRYITECDLYAHIAKIKDIYRRKCNLMLDCLAKELPDTITYTKPEGGLFIWCTLPDGVDGMEFVRACKAKKLLVVPGATFNCDQDAPSQGFRLNFSTPSDAQIVEGCARLGAVAKEFLN
jgi:2-aminoadipate transaminase